MDTSQRDVRKKSYASPQLVEYGNLVDLTQWDFAGSSDRRGGSTATT